MPGKVLVQNAFPLISAGTERSSVEFAGKGLIGKAKSQPVYRTGRGLTCVDL